MNIEKQNILFSVIICNFNYGRFLNQAIDSVLNQTYTNIELIVVDDGSTDESRNIINSYEDSRLIAVFQSNSGQASSLNVGFEKSKGDVICLLDSDDWWREDKLETVYHWHNTLKENYSLMQHNLLVWDNGETSPYKLVLPIGDCFAEMCKTGNIDYFVPTSGIVISRAVFEKIYPIPDSLKICADAYLTRTCIAFGMLISIPSFNGYYRKHSNTVFKNDKFDVDDFFNAKLLPLLNTFYKKNGIDIPNALYENRNIKKSTIYIRAYTIYSKIISCIKCILIRKFKIN